MMTYPRDSFPKYENCLRIGYEEASKDKIQHEEDHISKIRYSKSGLMEITFGLGKDRVLASH